MIHAMRDSYQITELCEALGVSRSGFYAAASRAQGPRARENQELLEEMRSIHAHRHMRCYGSPRMTRELYDAGFPCSVNRTARIMRAAGLRARPRKPFRPKTTQPDHQACPSPNLLGQAAAPDAPGTQSVSDITYIPTREGWLYLAVVIDLFSRSILGWKLSESMRAQIVTDAITQAVDTGLLVSGSLFHSDRGCQYSAIATRQMLSRLGLVQSMSAKGYCYDNAFAESAFASIKNELLIDGQPFETKAQARNAVFDYLESFYNRKRLHSSLGYKSPSAFLKDYFENQNSSLN